MTAAPLPVSRPDLKNRQWHAFTIDHDEHLAAAIYRARYGQPPELIIEAGDLLLLGPVPRELERGGGRDAALV